MSNVQNDRWLLPRRQTEVPTWDLLSEATLHGRREATYLVLAALYLVSTTALVVLGTSRVIDPGAVLGAIVPGLELPVAMLLPIGAIPFALGITALALVCELFGRRRATALVWVGLVASVGVVGLMRLGDVVDSHSASLRDAARAGEAGAFVGGDAFGVALALAACSLVAHAAFTLIFEALRRRTRGYWLWPRLIAGALLPLALGWGAFALALATYGDHLGTAPAREAITALALGAAAYALVCAIVLSVPVVIAVRALALFLRVSRIEARDEDADDAQEAPPIESPGSAGARSAATPPPVPPPRPAPALAQGSVAQDRPKPAVLVEDEEPLVVVPSRRSQRLVDTSAEMRFFTEGDALEAAD